MSNELFGSILFGETLFGGEPQFPVSDSDSGTLSAAEAQSLEVQRFIEATDAGTLSIAKALTLARALADTGALSVGDTATRSSVIFFSATDTGSLAGAESQSTGQFVFRTPPALRVTNYLRRTV